jgi:hypothetical protein
MVFRKPRRHDLAEHESTLPSSEPPKSSESLARSDLHPQNQWSSDITDTTMSSLSSRQFEVVLADISEISFRAARRVILHADVLRAAKMCAGDIVALSRTINATTEKVLTAINFFAFMTSHINLPERICLGICCGHCVAISGSAS